MNEMNERADAMRECGVYTCPDWCVQDGESEQAEHQHTEHFGSWVEGKLPDNGPDVAMRPRASWDTDNPHDRVEVVFYGANAEPMSDRPDVAANLWLTPAARDTFNEMFDQAWALVDQWRYEGDVDDDGPWQWAYDGAEADIAAAEREGS